jgi:ornithine cyclodeaminase
VTGNLDLVGAAAVRSILDEDRPAVTEIVRATYLEHRRGTTVNPRSQFLRFPDKPEARIIALPAFLGGEHQVAGIKWISSFPANIAANIPRASSVLILNDFTTGYPVACLEASHISASRTAASAVLGAEHLLGVPTAGTVLIVGAGVLGRTVADYLLGQRWTVGRFAVYDTDIRYAGELAAHIARSGAPAAVVPDVAAALPGADLIVLVTTAATPWLTDPAALAAGQVVLNISLRDLSAQVILSAYNIVDDIDHCLTASTSPHLAEQAVGHRRFIAGTLAELMLGHLRIGTDKPRIFSPFGLGVLDLALGEHVHQQATARGLAIGIPDFFGPTERWTRS